MEELDEQQEEQVQGTETQEIKITTPENGELGIDQVTTTPPNNEEESTTSFKELLEAGSIECGDKIKFTPKEGKETTITVDEAFLKLPVKDEEYYEKFNYKLAD